MEPAFLFAPGAGAASSHPWMCVWSERLRSIGAVRGFDYAYMVEGRKRPDRLPQLVATHRAALQELRQTHTGPVVLAGKSMGSRIGCHVSLEENVEALVCFGYPLCGGGDPGKRRDAVLLALRTPILFVQGTRDPLCPLELLAEVRARMVVPNELHRVEGGDHSLAVTKTALKLRGETQDDVDARILAAVRGFTERYAR